MGIRLLTNPLSSIPTVGFNMKRVQKGHVTLKWFVILRSSSIHASIVSGRSTNTSKLGSRWSAPVPFHVGTILPRSECDSVSTRRQRCTTRTSRAHDGPDSLSIRPTKRPYQWQRKSSTSSLRSLPWKASHFWSSATNRICVAISQ